MNLPIRPPTVASVVVGGATLTLIDDRDCAPLLGGNKARKLLGGILDDAARQGARRLFTFGAEGSHHVLATAVFGARAGLEVHAALWPQPATAHTRAVLEAGLREGLVAHHLHSARDAREALAALRVARAAGTYVVPLGGSTPDSLAAHARAARDLVAHHPSLSSLDALVLPLGSGGTATGVALGLTEALGAGGPAVHGVLVSPPRAGAPALAAGLLARAAARGLVPAKTARAAWRRMRADAGYLGDGYGCTTADVDAAIARAAAIGLDLEPTYTGKAFAAALALAARGLRVAFWMTLGRLPEKPVEA